MSEAEIGEMAAAHKETSRIFSNHQKLGESHETDSSTGPLEKSTLQTP